MLIFWKLKGVRSLISQHGKQKSTQLSGKWASAKSKMTTKVGRHLDSLTAFQFKVVSKSYRKCEVLRITLLQLAIKT